MSKTDDEKKELEKKLRANLPKFTQWTHYHMVAIDANNGTTNSHYGQKLYPVVEMDGIAIRKAVLRAEKIEDVRMSMRAFNNNSYDQAREQLAEYEKTVKGLIEQIAEEVPDGHTVNRLQFVPILMHTKKVKLAKSFDKILKKVEKAIADSKTVAAKAVK